jgi:O-antigen/teichoic acid export membrane protein
VGFQCAGTELTLDKQKDEERDDRNGQDLPSHGSESTQDAVSTVLKGSGAVLMGLLCRMGLLFLTELIAARHLGPSRYGLLTWGITAISIVSMFTMLGLNSAARRFVPIFRQQGDTARLSGLLRSATVLTASAGFVGMLVLYAAAEPLSLRALGEPKELPILQMLVIALPFWNLQKTFLALAAGFKRTWLKVMTEDIFVPLGFLTVVSIAASTGSGGLLHSVQCQSPSRRFRSLHSTVIAK